MPRLSCNAHERMILSDPSIDVPDDRHVLIAGPTASGKSRLAMEIAGRAGGMIVNADALQVYDCWRILTARPSAADEAAVTHALYGHVGRDQAYSAGHWLREVEVLLAGGQRLIVTGGTGLYFTALTEGLAVIPPVPGAVRAEADERRLSGGIAGMLADLDAETSGRIDRRNPARVQRAWEVQRATGRGLASWQDATPAPLLPLESCTALVLQADRDWLADRINRRFEGMLADGALEEVSALLPGWEPGAPWAQAIGAAELAAHLRGELGLAAAVTQAQAASRQYAKRQRTWFRSRMRDWRHVLLP